MRHRQRGLLAATTSTVMLLPPMSTLLLLTGMGMQGASFVSPFAVSKPPLFGFIRPTKLCYHRQHTNLSQRSRYPSLLFLSSSSSSSSVEAANGFVQAQDLGALQTLFSRYCDKEGLMTKASVLKIPAISELMVEGDLLPEEFNDIWDKAPKFPNVLASEEERIDVDSFVQVYRDIDYLYEDVDDDDNDGSDGDANKNYEEKRSNGAAAKVAASDAVATTFSAPPTSTITNVVDDVEEETDNNKSPDEVELESIFQTLCDKNELVSKQVVQSWDEVQKLIAEGLLGDDEFDDIWSKTKKSLGTQDMLDVDGFLSFNVALDSLFEFEVGDGDDDVDDDVDDDPDPVMIDGSDLSATEIFAALTSDTDGLVVTLEDLSRWGELQEMIADGDLLQSELDDLFAKFASRSKSSSSSDKLTQNGFVALYQAIDELFDDGQEEEEADDQPATTAPATTAPAAAKSDTKEDLLRTLDRMNRSAQADELLPCGLESTDREQREILKLVNALENEPTNIIRAKRGAVSLNDLAGTWEMLYSSSSAMKFNKGLSGLGGSFPNGRFAGLLQKLEMSSKFMSDVEYTERIAVKPDSASFDVKVTGDWELRQSVSLFTGEPSIVLQVTPDRVEYGPTRTRADHWKSLGPMNMLDVAYLDKDLRVMRGNTSVDTVFIFRRL